MASERQTIQDFYQVAQERDFSRNFQFRIGSITNQGAEQFTPEDLVYAQTASLPAREITNVTVAYMGLTFNLPGAATYGGSAAYPIAFRCDSEQIIRRMWENWQRLTFDDQTSTGDYRIHGTSKLTMNLLNQNMDVMRQYVLHGIWPVTISEIAYDTAGAGDVLTFTGTVAYQYWTRGI